MSRKLFGTDGVRGVANAGLTPELVLSMGVAAGRFAIEQGWTPRAVIGRDTRKSGTMLGAALASGLSSVGVDVLWLGIVPTPTVSFVARTQDIGLGAIISASHNPAPDNGIKFVGHDGRKLPDDAELRIEELMAAPIGDRPVGGDIGDTEVGYEAVGPYMDYLESLVPERLEGMHVAVDAAHGAAYDLGSEILRRLGAKITVIGDKPDGMNINAEGGATKPQTIQDLTVRAGADVGVAFDGDADRAVFSDEKGALINGDRTIAIWGAHWRHEGGLEPPIVVGTVMSNGGFESYLTREGITLSRTPVGDKYVSQKLAETGAKVGGEQSGHIIFPERGPTGDGLITMLELLRVLKREGRPASSFTGDFDPWPQLLINVAVASREGWDAGAKVSGALRSAEERLGQRGRLVVRPSGTQPMIRVMVEADDARLRDELADSIVAAMEEEVDGKVHGRVDLTHALGD